MIRGWRYIGRLKRYMHNYRQHYELQGDEPVCVDVGDVIAVSYSPSGPLRSRYVQVKEIDQEQRRIAATGDIPGCCGNDFVFVATALGENAFKRPGARNSE